MGRQQPIPESLFAPGRRHLVLLAHHDDELPYAGLLARMGENVRIIWLTNSDGLAHESDMTPDAYAQARYQESLDALGHLNIPEAKVQSLWHSEYELYDLMRLMRSDAEVPERFLTMADEVERVARDFEPDVVWTLAYQGGHPEHDLMHLYAARLVRRLNRERSQPVPFFELPAYELIVVPLRFRPWRRRPYFAVTLTDREYAAKSKMLDCYPTQQRIIDEFRSIITLYGRLSWLRLRPFSFDDFGRREAFGLGEAARDYTQSTHISSRLDYPFDDYMGDPIRFDATIMRVAEALELTTLKEH